MPEGYYVNRSTKLEDRKAAFKLAERWEDAARKRITETQARKVISDIYQETSGEQLKIPSVSSYLDQWVAQKTTETRPATLAHYRSSVNAFKAFLGQRASQPLHYVQPMDVAKWRDEIAARTSAKSANNRLKVLRVFFQSAWRESLILDNPAAKVKVLRSEESNRMPFTVDQVRALLAAATGEWKGIILFGLYTGQRLKDLATLTWPQIDLEAEVLSITTSKTGRRQIIPLAQPLVAYLDEIAGSDDPSPPLFPNSYQIVQKDRATFRLSAQFHGILAAAGLAIPRPRKHRRSSGNGRNGKRMANPLSFHSLRHTATTLLKASGAAESVVRDIIGHESVVVSRLYTHIGEDQKREAIQRLPQLHVGSSTPQ